MRGAGRTIGTLGLLTLGLPANAAVTASALMTRARPPRATASDPKTILISGGKMTKALQLARSFHAAGHRVILVETRKYRWTGHRFSRAVDRFHTVPDPAAPGYADALLAIVLRERVDVYVPVCSPAASYYDALAKDALAGHCEVLHLDAEMVRTLDDKHAFSELVRAVGLPVPECYRVTDPDEVAALVAGSDRPFILKSIAYDPVARLDLTQLPLATPEATTAFARSRPISPENPWILQEFITGQEYCTHSTVRDGEVQLHCCCRSSAFQLNYAMVEKPEIEAWVRRFVGALGLTGQVSFDFMETADGRVYAIECNPRTHSAITMFYNHPGVADAYLSHGVPTIEPLPSSRPTYWLYHELWQWLRHPRTTAARIATLRAGTDAIFDRTDPLPFLLAHHLQIPSLLLHNLRRGKPWERIDFNIGKLVEAAGD